MPYTIKSSEKTRKSGSDCETKALLYLMNFRKDSDEIYYFVVDFFNDLTGMDRYSENLWDVQSKAAKNNSPNAIGRELVTLFKNYVSDIDFKTYILFLGGVSSTVRIDDKLSTFGIDNVFLKSKEKIINGLKDEAKNKEYVHNSYINDDNINEFLNKVLFVIDDKRPSDYVKAIIKDHPNIIPEDKILDAIFNEIRNEQSAKKNTSVEGITIQTTDEALNYCRHLTNNEIRLLTLNRIISRNPVEKNNIPLSFVSIYNSWPPEHSRDMLDECVQSLCRALFNKNVSAEFWGLFESIYTILVENPKYSVQEVYNTMDPTVRRASPDFDTVSLKYFIAHIKDGIEK